MLGRRLTDDAHMAWKWGSIRFMALGGVAQSTVVAADTTGLAEHLPSWLLTALSAFAVFCIFAAGVSRITTKDCDHDRPGQPS